MHVLERIASASILGLFLAIAGEFSFGGQEEAAPRIAMPLDAVPFGFREDAADGTACGVRWAEPRRIRRVLVEFGADANVQVMSDLRLQYWHHSWDGGPEAVIDEINPIAYGWTPIDDWTQGDWKDADAKATVSGRRLIFTFAPTGEKEFPDLGAPGVSYRKTLKLRIVSDARMPRPRRLQALTDAMLRPLTVRITWDRPAAESLAAATDRSGLLEAFNGAVLAVRPLAGSAVKVEDKVRWTATADRPGGIEADLMIATDPNEANNVCTLVTVRSAKLPFTFDASEVARGERILVDDLGMLVTRGDDPISLAEYRESRQESPRKTVYARVFDRPEQTLANAWNDMPLRHPLWFVHGLPGNRNAFRQEPNGEIKIWQVARWFNLPKSAKDTDRKGFDGEVLSLDFGLPTDSLRGGRELLDGYLPQLRTWWTDGPLCYEQTTISDKLETGLDRICMDDPTVLLMRVRIANTSASEKQTARLRLTSQAAEPETLALEGDCISAQGPDVQRFRYLLKTDGRGDLSQEDAAVVWSLELSPGESHTLMAVVPSIGLLKPEEIELLRKREFDADSARICEFWKDLALKGAQIETPEPWLNDFYKAHLLHEEVTCVRDVEAARRYAKASTFSYGVFANESIMMTSELDRRGCHEAAEQCLQAFCDFQGTVPLPGNFKSQDGVFYGAGGWEHIGYNKHHGYVMWGIADHWRFTRDRQWMERVADNLVKACDWITSERQATMELNPDGSRPIHYGLLPTGGLEDVQDYWYWLGTNVSEAWGFVAAADALADYGHPQAARLKNDAQAYRTDVLAAFNEAKVRAPVVRLRDGAYVPKYPSRVYERGRSLGWIRETLEGSIGLLATGLIEPDVPEAGWILKDHEDNLYISHLYGYSIPVFEPFWFSRGGFSMQANLLDGPTCYLLRDEIPHFLRAFFNGFASGFFPEVRMLSEHSNPELGYPAGCHFKTPDESQVCGWLRMMFIREEEDNLYLGQAIPRSWLANGQRVAIRRAATWFGPMSLEIESRAADGQIEARFTPPQRNPAVSIFLRLRHPDTKPIQSVTLNGQKCESFDADKEWIVLPGNLEGEQRVVATY